MRTREHDWFDTKAMKPRYSFQVFANGKWCHPHDNGTPLIFKTKAERDKARAAARRLKEAK